MSGVTGKKYVLLGHSGPSHCWLWGFDTTTSFLVQIWEIKNIDLCSNQLLDLIQRVLKLIFVVLDLIEYMALVAASI
ncbi:hypothetical protein HanLR1_Chr15g0589571 [Helianthus annuus]|nr:hypothetical protein HanLR1_Chr15g0589571 [Helianthus annuus]